MKKIIYILIIMLSVAACTEKDSLIYEQKPDERIKEVLDNYNKIIQGSPNGWFLALETGEKGGFNHWVNFTGENTVEMLSDAEAESATLFGNTSTELLQSSWRLKSVETPILMFDTYSYIHMLADPSEDVNDGVKGKGYVTDFEFSLGNYDNSKNMLDLKGRFNGVKAKMIACNASQEEAIRNGGLKTMSQNFEAGIEHLKYPVINMGDNKVDLEISARQFGLKYIDDEDAISTSSVAAYLDMKGLEDNSISNLVLFDTLEYNGQKITGLVFENDKLFACVGGNNVEVVDNMKPAIPLRFGPGRDYDFMNVKAEDLEGSMNDPYLTNVYMQAKNTMYNKSSKRVLQYVTIQFIKDAKSGNTRMELRAYYKNSAGSTYQAIWDYKYTENEDGTITFTERDQSTINSNNRGQEPHLKAIVDYFCALEYDGYSTSSSTGTWAQNKARITKVTPRTFKIDWAENNTKGLSGSLGGFYPVDAEHMAAEGVCVGILSKK